MNQLLKLSAIPALLCVTTVPALAGSGVQGKFLCVPSNNFICANKALPLYKEGCQPERGPEGTLTLALDLDQGTGRHCWKSDGECTDESIEVEEVAGEIYIVRNATASANLRKQGVLDRASMSYAETSVRGAASESLLANVVFYKCHLAD